MEIGGNHEKEVDKQQAPGDTLASAQDATAHEARTCDQARESASNRVPSLRTDGELRRAAHIRAFADYLDGKIDACKCVDLIHNIYENAISYRDRSRGK